MELALIFLSGVCFGIAVITLMFRVHMVGTLRIEASDPDGPYMFLELSKDAGNIMSQKHVMLKVRTKR